MTEMTTEDRIQWFVDLGMTRADAEIQVEAEKITDDPVIPANELPES